MRITRKGPALRIPAWSRAETGVGRVHDLDQPAVQGELGGLQDRRRGEEDGGAAHRTEREARRRLGAGGVEDGAEVTGAEVGVEEGGARHQGEVAHPGGDELLPGRDDRPGSVRVEDEQAVQGQAGGDPGGHQQGEVAGEHEHLDGGDGDRQAAQEGAVALVAVEVGAAVAHDGQGQQRDHGQHEGAHRVDPHRQAQSLPPQGGALGGAPQPGGGRRPHTHHRAGPRGGADRPHRPRGPPTGLRRGDPGGGEVPEGGEQGQECERRRHDVSSPRASGPAAEHVRSRAPENIDRLSNTCNIFLVICRPTSETRPPARRTHVGTTRPAMRFHRIRTGDRTVRALRSSRAPHRLEPGTAA